ncbi:hypothetical protein HanIR_Chr04g0176941 [Helianthus annuus]|nr:hypothetical protein HanIR_Chr04g0176941 [Helianthus annuus]
MTSYVIYAPVCSLFSIIRFIPIFIYNPLPGFFCINVFNAPVARFAFSLHYQAFFFIPSVQLEIVERNFQNLCLQYLVVF